MTQNLASEQELQRLIDKAGVLMEALPHIQRFRDAAVVIKYGGHAMIDAGLKEMVMQDLVLMENIGINPIVVHGGGPEITALMDRVGLQAQFVDGQRVTDADALDIAEMVLAGKLNGDIVTRLNRLGGRAVGLSGKDAQLIVARKLVTEAGRDIGYVGEVEQVNVEILRILERTNYIPVISPIGAAADGQTYNINADTVAAQCAMALQARKLILLTDVRGICRDPRDPATLLNRVAVEEIEPLIREGVIKGGMIPKVRACRDAIAAGVASAHILDGRLPHALLIELFTDRGIGTMITA
ncbi:MAG TPA: acetylglutamate kinase [Candidatus Sumerlaeota bacterium]|nr:MAG: Acetylglutamate kinase [candidate division BRC1 bacterium ADurb.BinA292]HOE96128.1 acetylglutamate kinase [Candidatus Sumerlaeota bacterium]HOR27898.1 acetylglutamate kinase [Candidatus Sumerlaeota bacterium]